ncbi:MAG: VOC family protein [Deltaproteobacteria bacterium]|nr:VOC family protein [Deltaproteobacteria bacterium]MBI3386558.1 VOC family protein [Deltaproteobacteria bacterium]
MQIKKLRQVFIATTDPAAQARFYAETLGLPLQFRDGDRWIQFQAGDVSLAIACAEEGMGAPLNVPTPVFEVADLDTALAELSASGHRTTAIRDMGTHGRTAGVTDPNGAFLVLFQRAT